MTALLLLSHQPAVCVNRMTAYWKELTNPAQIVVAYGGPESEFAAIDGTKAFIDDPRLRTRDHQRERQSYTKMLQASVEALGCSDWDHLYIAEFDMLPLAGDLWETLEKRAAGEGADLLGYRAWRIDNTLHPHFRDHLSTRTWLDWIQGISRRDDPHVVLSCMGCGQWWRREALEAVLELGEPEPAYLELQLPTVAHHLGFRVRGMGGQTPFVRPSDLLPEDQNGMKTDGAWIIHPLKELWGEIPDTNLNISKETFGDQSSLNEHPSIRSVGAQAQSAPGPR